LSRQQQRKFSSNLQAFGDTEASTRSKVALPQWGDLFNMISREEYPEYIPHNDLDIRVLNDQVFPNI
jgi:hypothetical protein